MLLLFISSCKRETVEFDCPLVSDYLGDFSYADGDDQSVPRGLILRVRTDGLNLVSIDHFEPDYLSEDSISGIINIVTDIRRQECRYYLGPIKLSGTYTRHLENNCLAFEFEGMHEYIVGSGCNTASGNSYSETLRANNFKITTYDE